MMTYLALSGDVYDVGNDADKQPFIIVDIVICFRIFTDLDVSSFVFVRSVRTITSNN